MLLLLAPKGFIWERSSSHFNMVVYDITKETLLEEDSLKSPPLKNCLGGSPLTLQRADFTKFPWCGKQEYL